MFSNLAIDFLNNILVFFKTNNARVDRVRMVKWVTKHMYCKQELDETLIVIKSELEIKAF